MPITVIERTVYYVDHFEYETQFECDHDEEGWYVELSYSDGGFDVYGPYNSKEEASNVF